MTRYRLLVLVSVLSLLAGTGSLTAHSAGLAEMAAGLGTGFTYQGNLASGGNPVTGACDFQFGVWDAASGGTQAGVTQTVTSLSVNAGLFTATLNEGGEFGGSAFAGQARWLALAVRCPVGSGDYAPLTPRQALTATPYALYALAAGSAPWAGLTGVPAGFADNTDNDTLYAAGTGLTLSGGTFAISNTYQLPQGCGAGKIAEWSGAAWVCGDDDTSGGGSFWSLTGNAGATSANFLGTTDNLTLTFKVSGTTVLRLVPTGGEPNILGGAASNSASAGVTGSTIGGGYSNQVNATAAVVGGGYQNVASGGYAVVGGGAGNTASDYGASIAGGIQNIASTDYATVGGGAINTASDLGATVAGGYQNNATNDYATVGGGTANIASGSGATIGGGGHNGSVVDGNLAQGDASTIGGGYANVISATAGYATIGGGDTNLASSNWATVSGGGLNTASGGGSTVGGGYGNTASGAGATVGGGGYNGMFYNGNRARAVASTIGGGYANVITTTATDSTIGGGSFNTLSALAATIGGGSTNVVSSTANYGTIGGGGFNAVNGHAATVGGGGNNLASGYAATVGGGDSNHATGNAATVGGGDSNLATDLDATVGGGVINVASNDWATVAGGGANTASGMGSTVAGGTGNTASGAGATVGGGGWNGSATDGNQALGLLGTIAGGYGNAIESTAAYATIGGGYDQLISSAALYSTISGGYQNTTSGANATVGGGSGNTASGNGTTIPGGQSNTASGVLAFAAGWMARATHNGAWVWADATGTAISSTTTNQFLVRASGGVTMYTNAAGSVGAALMPGSGSWTVVSDRNAKANVAPVDEVAILEALMGIPLATWNYTSQDPGIRHMGPMAQDFYAAFGLGETDTGISAVDADGVALAAIQGLYAVIQEKEAEIAALRISQDDLADRVAALEQGVAPNRGFYGQLLLGLLLGAGAFAMGRQQRR